MRINRILISLALLLICVSFYEVRLKPHSRPLYERALRLYRAGNYIESLQNLEEAGRIEPNSTAILVLRGWDHLRLRQYAEARANFERATRLDPDLTEAQLGLAYVSAETGTGAASMAGIKALLDQDPNNPDYLLAAATAYRHSGRNIEAQKVFERLNAKSDYREVALKNLREMYGLEGTTDKIPDGIPVIMRPEKLHFAFRAAGSYLQLAKNKNWENFYVKGVNLRPAYPGDDAPNSIEVYRQYLHDMAQLGVNTVRAYDVLPPAFYRALKIHNERPDEGKIYLLQGVPVFYSEEPKLFDADTDNQAREAVLKMVDAIHGQGDLAASYRRVGGLYVVDVSPYVLGFLIGGEVAPHIVVTTNQLQVGRNNYQGTYVSVPRGKPTEVWFARLLDFAAGYEVEKYNEQHPLSIVNWPALDPLNHPTEAGLMEQLDFRKRTGERIGPIPAVYDDNDADSLDETRFWAEGPFEAGIFASYNVSPSFPNFLTQEPGLLAARDEAGPNAYFGYLKALRSYYSKMPLLIADYGAPSSLGISRMHPQGMNEGGLNERQQGEMLARMTRNIAAAGCAGGIVFEWQDQWQAGNWLASQLEVPADRRSLWPNVLNASEAYGLWTYDPSATALFKGAQAWSGIKPLYQKTAGAVRTLSDGEDAARTLRSLSVSSDEAYLYLRLAVEALPRGAGDLPRLDGVQYLIAISTFPDRFGGRTLPGLQPRVGSREGFNFLLTAGGPGPSARLLVASNYSAHAAMRIGGTRDRYYLGVRPRWRPALEDWTPFEDEVVEPNHMNFGRDGKLFDAVRHDLSPLRFGSLDPAAPHYDSLATWMADFAGNSLVFRIPWAMLQVTDPSSRRVYAGTDDGAVAQAEATSGISLAVVSFKPQGTEPNWSRYPADSLDFSDSLPGIRNGVFERVARYRWSDWNTVKLKGRMKAGAATLQKAWREVRPR